MCRELTGDNAPRWRTGRVMMNMHWRNHRPSCDFLVIAAHRFARFWNTRENNIRFIDLFEVSSSLHNNYNSITRSDRHDFAKRIMLKRAKCTYSTKQMVFWTIRLVNFLRLEIRNYDECITTGTKTYSKIFFSIHVLEGLKTRTYARVPFYTNVIDVRPFSMRRKKKLKWLLHRYAMYVRLKK